MLACSICNKMHRDHQVEVHSIANITNATVEPVGVGAQTTLGGKTFKICMKN